MIKASSVFLCENISARDARRVADWLEDPVVSRFLNEEKDTASALRRLAQENEFLLTYHLNQKGPFYLVRHNQDMPVGFIRLQPNESETEHEVVIAIGERSLWGNGIGSDALRHILYLAFFQYRTEKVVAKIHHGNHRSIRLFIKAGFALERKLPQLGIYTLTRERYLSAAAKRA